jgi:peptide deformylase
MEERQCPCGSGESYKECCELLHKGKRAQTALQLMRSRYTAYVLDLPEYIIQTTHPASPGFSEDTFAWKKSLSNFSRQSAFQRLEILDFKEAQSIATVVFTAYLLQEGRDATFTEKSHFEKKEGRWLYRGGQLAAGRAPNLITTGQLRLLPLAYYGDPILRKQGDLITEITEDVKKLVEEMVETMDACDGLGLAAPQIHHSIRLFVIRTPIERETDQLELGDVKVFINPKVSMPSKETWTANEGCLSIPGIQGLVERPREITVEYTQLDGTVVKTRFAGWEARVIMHENDHINGVLFLDRMEAAARKKLTVALQKLEKRLRDPKVL